MRTSLVEPTNQFIDFDSKQRSLLAAFKELVRASSTVSVFRTAEELAAKVATDLAKYLTSQGADLGMLHPSGDAATTKTDLVPLLGGRYVGKTVYAHMLSRTCGHDGGIRRRGLIFECEERWKVDPTAPFSRPGASASPSYAASVKRRSLLGIHDYRLRFLDTPGECVADLYDPNWYSGKQQFQGRDYGSAMLQRCSALALFLEVTDQFTTDGSYVDEQDVRLANVLLQLATEYSTGVFPRPVALVLTKCDRRIELFESSSYVEAYFSKAYPVIAAQAEKRLKTWALFPTSALGIDVGRAVENDESAWNRELRPEPKGIWEPIWWMADHV